MSTSLHSGSESLSDGYTFESGSDRDSFLDDDYGDELTESRLSTLAEEEEEVRTDLITPSQSASQGPYQENTPVEDFCYTAVAVVNWWDSGKGQFHNVHQFGQKCWVEIKLDSINAYEMIPDERSPSGFQKKLLAMPLLSVVLDIDKSVAEGNLANVDLTLSGKFRGESHLGRRLLREIPKDHSNPPFIPSEQQDREGQNVRCCRSRLETGEIYP